MGSARQRTDALRRSAQPRTVTFYEEIAAVQDRLARAHTERDAWRASGMQEKYLESYSMVEALELQLERLRQEGLRASARNDARFAVADPPGAPEGRERQMAEFSITYNGRQYQYDRYRYDRLADAVDYARLRRSMPPGHDAAVPMPAPQTVESPDEAQRRTMAALSITFQDGVYSVGAYRYDRLEDAARYARSFRL